MGLAGPRRSLTSWVPTSKWFIQAVELAVSWLRPKLFTSDPSVRRIHDTGDNTGHARTTMNRTQALLIGFLILSWVALVAILVGAPEIYDAQLRPLGLAGLVWVRLAFITAITSLLVLLAIGTLRRWRWMFWLLLIAFAAGALRVPISALQIVGAVASDVPLWYAGLQALVGIVQVVIAVAMIAGYRRNGLWGAF
jgi:hypothetical protein